MKANCTRCFLSSRANSTSFLVAELETGSFLTGLECMPVRWLVRWCERGRLHLSVPPCETIQDDTRSYTYPRLYICRRVEKRQSEREPKRKKGRWAKGETQSGLVDDEDDASLP